MKIMSWQVDRDLAVAFLRAQMNELDSRITRLQSALENCEECLEADGLQASLQNIELERHLLNELLMHQLGDDAVSLDALIMREAEQSRRESNRLAQNWQRGQQTPSAYWDAELRQSFLNELLSRYHAWQNGRPYYAAGSPSNGYLGDRTRRGPSFPWFAAPVTGDQPSMDEANTFREAIFSDLRRNGYPFDHLHIIIQPGGQVMVTGYAHDDYEREQILQIITKVESVRQVLSDVKVVDPAHCPICHPNVKNGGAASGP
jgi:hypothetical protein